MPLLPDASDLPALAAAMNENARESEQFGGYEITLEPGDLTPGTGGSVSDAAGDVYTLPYWSGPVFGGVPMGEVFVNGEPNEELGGGFVVAIRIVNGEAFFENAKGYGWSNADENIGNNIGVGDSSGVTPPVVADDPPVAIPDDPPPTTATDTPPPTGDPDTPPIVTAENPPVADPDTPPVATEENPPAVPADDTVSNPSDVVHALFHQAHHHHAHRMNFVRETTPDTAATGDISASANVGAVNPAAIAALGASVVADLTAAGAADTPIATAARMAATVDDALAQHGIVVDDPSAASLSQLFAGCSHQRVDPEAAAG